MACKHRDYVDALLPKLEEYIRGIVNDQLDRINNRDPGFRCPQCHREDEEKVLLELKLRTDEVVVQMLIDQQKGQ